MSQAAALSRTSLLLLIAAFAVVWFGTLEHRRLINPDEGRYAEIPREMVASGDWITPRLNDIKYFYKPPLQYWATAAAFSAFGEHHWTARLWPALTGFLGILLTGFAAARLYSPLTGIIAGAILASSVLWNVIGHANTLDMGVSSLLAAAILALCLAQRDDSPESRRWRDGAWVLLALATLSKGQSSPTCSGNATGGCCCACARFAALRYSWPSRRHGSSPFPWPTRSSRITSSSTSISSAF
jgi:4-amino-4-deoxy-L-arabinose transferase-like glycosyltransferase